jgi:hypothetical protein
MVEKQALGRRKDQEMLRTIVLLCMILKEHGQKATEM